MAELGGSKMTPNQQAQPAGVPTPGGTRPGATNSADGALLDQFDRLCAFMPEVEDRLAMLGVPAKVEAAWHEGRMLPALRARRKPIVAAVEQFERAAPSGGRPDR